jgi:hypothetical protein
MTLKRNVPIWAQSKKALWLRVAGPRLLRRYDIAELYWLQSWPASRIARHLGVSVGAVKQVLNRIRGTRTVPNSRHIVEDQIMDTETVPNS